MTSEYYKTHKDEELQTLAGLEHFLYEAIAFCRSAEGQAYPLERPMTEVLIARSILQGYMERVKRDCDQLRKELGQ